MSRRNNSQRGRYAKRKGANFERRTAHKLTKWAHKSFGMTAQFGRTLSSGASSNQFINPSSTLLGDIFAQSVPNWNFSIECKYYNSTSLRRFYMGSKRLSDWLQECTRDALRHTPPAVPMLIMHIVRFRDMVILPYDKKMFMELIRNHVPAFTTYYSYVVKRTGHRFKFHMMLTDLKSITKTVSCHDFIKIYSHVKWNKLNTHYARRLTHTYMAEHSRKQLNINKLVKHGLRR